MFQDRVVDGISYGYETLQKMMETETEMKRYEKIGNKAIFKDYFRVLHDMNTEKFCDMVDGFPDKQPEKCSKLYGGPLTQGLVGGFTTLISFAEAFSMKIKIADLNDPNQLKNLMDDPTFKKLRILLRNIIK